MGKISKKLGLRIKELRESKKISQLKLAEIINMEASNLSKIERGVQIPKEEGLIRLSEALDVPVKELFNYEHFMEKAIIINKITDILNNSDEKLVQKYYKILLEIK